MIRLLIIVVALFCLVGTASIAGSSPDYNNALRLVVITDDEGIHYAHGCAFYELRNLLADGASNAAEIVADTGVPTYEIRLLGKFGERTVYLGNYWLVTPDGTVPLTTATYSRIIELIETRKGQGVATAGINTSVRSALEQILDPAYIEDDRCSTR